MATTGNQVNLGRICDGATTLGLSPAELLGRFNADRDEAAFAALVAHHGPMVLATCRRILPDRADADDAFQATFLVFARRARSIRDPGRLALWLHHVARRVAVRARKLAARRRRVEGAEPGELAGGPAVDDPHELRSVLDEELARLPARFRAPLVLCYLEGLTHDEAACRLACPVGTVRSRLARGRDRLRAHLMRRGFGPSAVALPPTLPLAVVPPALQALTVRLVLTTTARTAADVAAVLLARGVSNSMFITKVQTAAACAVATMSVVAVGIVSAQAPGGGPQANPANPLAIAPAPIEPKLDQATFDDLARDLELMEGNILGRQEGQLIDRVAAERLRIDIAALKRRSREDLKPPEVAAAGRNRVEKAIAELLKPQSSYADDPQYAADIARLRTLADAMIQQELRLDRPPGTATTQADPGGKPSVAAPPPVPAAPESPEAEYYRAATRLRQAQEKAVKERNQLNQQVEQALRALDATRIGKQEPAIADWTMTVKNPRIEAIMRQGKADVTAADLAQELAAAQGRIKELEAELAKQDVMAKDDPDQTKQSLAAGSKVLKPVTEEIKPTPAQTPAPAQDPAQVADPTRRDAPLAPTSPTAKPAPEPAPTVKTLNGSPTILMVTSAARDRVTMINLQTQERASLQFRQPLQLIRALDNISDLPSLEFLDRPTSEQREETKRIQGLVGLLLKGDAIEKVAVFDRHAMRWFEHDLAQPAAGVVTDMSTASTLVGFSVHSLWPTRELLVFDARDQTWTTVTLPEAIEGDIPAHSSVYGMVAFDAGRWLAIYSQAARKASVLELARPTPGPHTSRNAAGIRHFDDRFTNFDADAGKLVVPDGTLIRLFDPKTAAWTSINTAAD